MAGYLQDLIDQIALGDVSPVKTAADSSKDKDEKSKNKDEKKDDDKKKDRGGSREFFENMKNRGGKKDDKSKDKEKDKDDEKKDKEKKAFDLLAFTADLPDDMRKAAAAEAEAEFLAELAQMNAMGGTFNKTASVAAPSNADGFDERALFNESFSQHTAKLAALDPAYSAAIDEEVEKQAFNQGFNDALAAVQAGVNPFATFGG